MSKQVRQVDWTPDLVARFWDNLAGTDARQDQYFTFQVGQQIVNFLGHIGDVKGLRVLDYGCGPGFLVDYLLKAGAHVTAADYSPESVKAAEARFHGRSGWNGAFQITDGSLDADAGMFDLVTCIETIEHMFEDARIKLLSEFRRVLKPAGRLFLTTPNEEDLGLSMIFCPNCAHTFHNMQHISSWNGETLGALLTEAGFDVDFCRGVDLYRWGVSGPKGPLDWSLRDVVRGAREVVLGSGARLADMIAPRPFPKGRVFGRLLPTYRPVHLVAVATRK